MSAVVVPSSLSAGTFIPTIAFSPSSLVVVVVVVLLLLLVAVVVAPPLSSPLSTVLASWTPTNRRRQIPKNPKSLRVKAHVEV